MLTIDLSTKQFWYPAKARDFTLSIPVNADEESPSEIGWQKSLEVVLKNPPDKDRSRAESEKVLVEFGLEKPRPARMLATFAENRHRISLTLRFDEKTPDSSAPFPRELEDWPVASSDLIIVNPDDEYLFHPDAIADGLLQQWKISKPATEASDVKTPSWKNQRLAFPLDTNRAEGLIVIAGATNTGKSVIAKTLALRYLISLVGSPTTHIPPHFVTFEDPIENWRVRNQQKTEPTDFIDLESGKSLQVGISITARERGKDVSDLDSACREALRQTPACFYIGEVRDIDDWKHALELATTGHLVITTTHASSLAETFAKICGRPGIKSPFSRGSIAQSIRGIVHLKGATVLGMGKPQGFASTWINTPESVNNFKSAGLSSIIVDGKNILGYAHMAELVFARMKTTGIALLSKEEEGLKTAEALDLRKS